MRSPFLHLHITLGSLLRSVRHHRGSPIKQSRRLGVNHHTVEGGYLVLQASSYKEEVGWQSKEYLKSGGKIPLWKYETPPRQATFRTSRGHGPPALLRVALLHSPAAGKRLARLLLDFPLGLSSESPIGLLPKIQ